MPPAEKLTYKFQKDFLTKEKPEKDRWKKRKSIKEDELSRYWTKEKLHVKQN